MDIEYLSERVRVWTEQNCGGQFVPPSFSEWLHYWNDDDTVIGNLRNLEHWLDRAKEARKSGSSAACPSHRSVKICKPR